MQSLWPKEFRFMPKEWSLPHELEECKSNFNEGSTYILKPSGGSQGCGIEVVQYWDEVLAYVEKNSGSDKLQNRFSFCLQVLISHESVVRAARLLYVLMPALKGSFA